MRDLMYFLIVILLMSNTYLFVDRQNIVKESELLFDKGVKKSFHAGWLTGANQVRDFGNCNIQHDTLMIMLKKDTLDFNNLMGSN